ncbi:pantothenate kinase 4-like isoform X2 [Pomacea canaliculata]|uniref:pantothenate kinase 4-like isoform X2 n=1 Tax=Pomacea canaliculata TaxID=400727 RepID=UPI000D73AE08|nr:pantothenate kinase 4-like isoform X2 [Pomacea canaliculata]
MTHQNYARSIELPKEQIFPNLKNAKRFAIDIGGSLAKVAYSADWHRRAPIVYDEPDTVTGGGAYKYKDLITSRLGVQVDKEDEIECLIYGCNFLLKNIPDEAFIYLRHGNPDYKFQGVDQDVFPYLLVNIGSGVSLVKVESDTKFERIGGTSTGGGTFWGLGCLLTQAKSFDDLLELAENGDHRSVDMLVKDIYGGAYNSLGLGADIIASSFGKATRLDGDRFQKEDIVRSLLLCISNDIGQIAYLQARLHGLTKIYFGGYFIRGHPLTMHTIAFAINYWSKGEIKALFLRHEGYLGAIGAFLKGANEEDAEKYCWGENLAGSSGLTSPNWSCAQEEQLLPTNFTPNFDLFELDRLERPVLACPLLLDPSSYFPDTVDLMYDIDARMYWLKCFEDSVEKTVALAIKSQAEEVDVEERARKFREKYVGKLRTLLVNPCAYGSLTVRSLLDTSSQCLAEFLFPDPYSQQKVQESELALKQLSGHLSYLDTLSGISLHIQLARGLLAGNVFDWGAKEIRELLETGHFSFKDAQNKLQERPWLIDDLDSWSNRLMFQPPYRCAAIFCDNSGADIILGIMPFARHLLSMGTEVILCANSRPTLNDVTYKELVILVKRVAELCPVISIALARYKLVVMESGQGSPCLDLRFIDQGLAKAMVDRKADLIVLEGMGRAVHTNLYAAFACDSLKVAVLKNRWLANRLGGDMFSVMFKFERSQKTVASPSMT